MYDFYYNGLYPTIEKHRELKYLPLDKAAKKVNNSRFRAVNQITQDLYEVSMAKSALVFDLPIQIGFFVYNYAKLTMYTKLYNNYLHI